MEACLHIKAVRYDCKVLGKSLCSTGHLGQIKGHPHKKTVRIFVVVLGALGNVRVSLEQEFRDSVNDTNDVGAMEDQGKTVQSRLLKNINQVCEYVSDFAIRRLRACDLRCRKRAILECKSPRGQKNGGDRRES